MQLFATRSCVTACVGLAGAGVIAVTPVIASPPRVQSLAFAVPPANGSPLDRALADLVAWLNDPAAPWPATVPVAPPADAGLIARRLRMAAVWAGQVTPGAFAAGDGSSSATVELSGEHATINLSVVIDPQAGQLRQADAAL